MKFKRKDTEIFSLSFLDCVCCGFGAVLLLFVITASRKADTQLELRAQIDIIIGQMEDEIDKKNITIANLRRSLTIERKRNQDSIITLKEKNKLKTELDEELSLLLAKLMSLEEALGKLMKDKENMPTQEEEPPLPIPNEEKRQYLTGFDMLGDNVLFLIEASGGMTSDTQAEAQEFIGAEDDEKRKAPKWSRVKKAMQWLIGNLKLESNYKVVFFNNEIHAVTTRSGQEWFDPSDPDLTEEVLEEIDKFVPNDGANLERAFVMVNEMPIEPDRVILIVDGLPTQADSYDAPSALEDHDRMNMFRIARKALTTPIPINTLLFPMKGDPAAAVHYWRLSDENGGAMVCPSRTWPDI